MSPAIIHRFKPKPDKSIPFIVFITFLATFIASRLVTYFLPDLFLKVKGEHVHHFAYGIILLSLIGFITIVYPVSLRGRLRLSVLYGIALGLAFDEFAMWIEMDDVLYHARVTYDALLVIALLLLNFIYFADFWKKWGHRLGKLFFIIFLWLPKKIILRRLTKNQT